MSTIQIDREVHNDASVWGTAIKWGIIGALINSALTMVWYNLGMMDLNEDGSQSSLIPMLAGIAIGIGMMILGLKEYRDKANAGELTMGRGIIWSLAYGLIGGIVAGIFVYLFYSVLAPDFLVTMQAAQEAQLEEQGITGSDLEAAMESISTFMSPAFMVVYSLLWSLLASLIIGAIISLILKTR